MSTKIFVDLFGEFANAFKAGSKILVDANVGDVMLRNAFTLCALLAVGLLTVAVASEPAQQQASTDGYTLRLPVDEVILTFNAEYANGLPVRDLKASEMRLRDNGLLPRRIVQFEELVNRPIRAGILLDTSYSMQRTLNEGKAIAKKFLESAFRQEADQAFVMGFGYTSAQIQPWTGELSLLTSGIEGARATTKSPGGTALYNAVFRACSSAFDGVDPTATGNVIMLFSDGEDNAGLTSADDTVRACQRSNTRIFAFMPNPAGEQTSTGPKKLRDLAARTGGQVFAADEPEEAIWRDLKSIETEVRNQYRLVYKPSDLRHDGAFHAIDLQLPDRVGRVVVRSGYFAPMK